MKSKIMNKNAVQEIQQLFIPDAMRSPSSLNKSGRINNIAMNSDKDQKKC